MIKPILKITLFLFLVAIGIFTSCKKEASQPSWDVDVLAPLIKSSLSINDLVTDTLLQSNPDSSVKIVYNGDLINFSSDTLANVPDTVISNSFKTPLSPYTYAGGTKLIQSNQEIDFKISGVELKKATIKTQLIKLHIENRIDSMVYFEYGVPCAKLGGQPFQLTDSIPGKVGANPAIYDTIIDLSGYSVDLTGFSGAKYNIITTHLLAKISDKVPYVVITNSDSLYIVNTVYNVKPAYASGYLGQTSITVGPQQSDFSLFKNIKSGMLNLPNAKISLELENSIGADARLKISKISSINNRTASTVDLACSAVINKSININRATETGIAASPVSPSVQTIVLNNSNSNIAAFISNMPDKLSYTMQVNVNPLGNVSGSNDFVYSGYGIKAKMNVEIPLSMVATNLTLSDTLMLDLSSIQGQEKINSGNLYLYANNGLPFDATIQIYLLDNNLAKTDSLIIPPNNTIVSAKLGSNQKVSQIVNTKLTIPVSKSKIDELIHTKKALVVARFNTANQPNPVNIYNYYKLDFKLIADVNYTFSGTKK
jgi:hypothetical protein